jgi:ubiquinone/menaquinone biosynthesis C-methylase UbiE
MQPIYDHIGQGYDATRRADPFLASRLRALAGLESPRALCLDLACGTANYTLALRDAGLEVIGADLSLQMLANARRKSADLPLVRTDAAQMAFASDSFDGATLVLAMHHMARLGDALAEVFRVLKPGARLAAFTSDPDQMRGYWLNEYFPQAMRRSIDQMPARGWVTSLMAQAGFREIVEEPYFIAPDLRDFFLYSGKRRPDIYLDPAIRSNISTFSALSDQSEVEAGCRRLREDIASGQIERVLEAWPGESGDYLFIAARKESSPR